MGVDIERISVDKEAVLASQVTAKEKQLLQHIPMDSLAGYTAIWSAKEALSKVLKTGMTVDFSLLEMSRITLKNNILECEFRNFGQYKALAYISSPYAVAVVLPKRTTADFSRVWQLVAALKKESI
jgi:phosphopantetheinyl transferase